jgi:murein DD-endopeptidase MepM/ murein hydrolase activator NlpD
MKFNKMKIVIPLLIIIIVTVGTILLSKRDTTYASKVKIETLQVNEPSHQVPKSDITTIYGDIKKNERLMSQEEAGKGTTSTESNDQGKGNTEEDNEQLLLSKADEAIAEEVVSKQKELDILAKAKEKERSIEMKALNKQIRNLENGKNSIDPPKEKGEVPSIPPTYSNQGSGIFIKPAPGVITTEFGNDILEGEARLHYGLDIAKRGYVPILAAADGYVIRNYYEAGGYGNAIFLTHSIQGKTYTTVYGHLAKSNVHEGEYIKQGQIIGVMGSTGLATGQHLHFEIHEGPWNKKKSNAVTPRKYLDY